MGSTPLDISSYTLSRVAESLYWMSRYLERAEHIARLIDVHQNLMLDSAPEILAEARLTRLLLSVDQDIEKHDLEQHDDILKHVVFDKELPNSIAYCITAARENARQIREQISSEMWLQINRMYLNMQQADPDDVWQDVPHNFFVSIKEGSHLFQGITDSTMNHNQGWYFIQIGRYLERLQSLVTFLNVQLNQSEDFADNSQGNLYFELVAMLKSISAFEAYCKVYNPEMKPEWIVEFLLFNAEFPRSARFCTRNMLYALEQLADKTVKQKNQRANRLAGRLESTLSFDEIDDVLSGDFHDYLMNIKQQAFHIHDNLYQAYITYPIEDALR